jgi:hypothetical protein
MAIFHGNSIPAGGSGYNIDNSLRFNDDDSPYMTFTPGSAGNRKTFTISFWFKRGNIDPAQHVLCAATSSDKITVYGDYLYADIAGITSEASASARTLLRDPSAWYHIVLAVDTTQSTSTNRIKWYLNGSQMTAMTSAFPSLNADSAFNNNTAQRIGTNPSPGYNHDGYISEFHMVDGTALDQTSFGETGDYGEWKPIQYTGSHGTNGYHLDFSNSSALGDDAAGSNNFTVTNITASDQVKDSPTNNFCTMNPLDNYYAGSTFSQGNLGLFITGSAQPTNTATFGMTSGKWYWEVRQGVSGAGGGGISYLGYLGIAGSLGDAYNSQLGENYDQYSLYAYSTSGRNVWHNSTWYAYGADITYTNGDIISMALDLDNNKMYWAKNGSYVNSGNPAGNSNGFSVLAPSATSLGAYFPAAGDGHSSSENFMFNFGQEGTFAGNVTAGGNADGNDYGNFKYAVPSGFLSLCTANLPDSTVVPSEHFTPVIYTGTGATKSVTGVGFQPDLVWMKSRSNSYYHQQHDAVRGANKQLRSNHNQAEQSLSGTLTSFDSDGFSLGSDTNTWEVNKSGSTYVAWNWKANGSGSANTDGSISSTVSANTNAGFSIITYSGASGNGTVGHGLSKAPNLVITKSRNAADQWRVGSIQSAASMDFTDYLRLNDAGSFTDEITTWNDTAPTSSVFSVGIDSATNHPGYTYVSYCFHDVEGYSKIGQYKGNGNVDGTFVYTGFKPAFVICKKIDASGGWIMHDNARNPSNLTKYGLLADTSAAETSTDNMIDLLSNGFKRRAIDGHGNGTNIYLYYAIAEQPFKHTNAR